MEVNRKSKAPAAAVRSNNKKMPDGLLQAITVMVMFVSSFAAGMGFILIAGANVPRIIAGLCACVLVILPSFCAKTFAVFTGLMNRRLLCLLSSVGFMLSLYPILCYFVSHDYQLSVYRYMKTTSADIYYFGGLDDIKRDYDSVEDYISQMRQAPASIVLQSMSDEKLNKLSADELKTINNESLWDYCGFDEILGTTPDEVIDSMEHAADINAYDFTFDYRGLSPKNLGYMLKNPAGMLREVAVIFRDGSNSVTPAVFIFFLIGQAFAIFMISMHFDVDDKGQLVYVYETRARSLAGDIIGFFKSSYGRKDRKMTRRTGKEGNAERSASRTAGDVDLSNNEKTKTPQR